MKRLDENKRKINLVGKNRRGLLITLFLFVFFQLQTNNVFNQEAPLVNPLEKGFVYNFTDNGKYFVKYGADLESWVRFLQYNPGTKDPSGDKIESDFDFVLRRSIISTVLKLDRFTAFLALGTGTQSYAVSMSPYTISKPTIYYYDFWGSYEVFKDALRLGYGLNLYKGLSRYSSASAARTIGADVPMLSAPDVLTTEQTARHLGFFAAGNIKYINYRLIIGKPFLVNSLTRPAYSLDKAADVPNSHFSTQGYFAFQFLDKESSFLPFYAATYLGKKKIFNIGTGFYSHPKSTQSINDAGDTITHNKFHYAIDVFFEYPVLSGGVFTFYSAFFKYNYGPNYNLTGGVANVLATSTSTGLSEPNFGSGRAVALQLAFLFPKVVGKTSKIQIYYEGNYMFFDALNDAALHHNLGITSYVHDHNLKFTLQYELRPFMQNDNFDSYKSLIIFKNQFYF